MRKTRPIRNTVRTRPAFPANGNRVVSLLMEWFARCARDLPWRHTRDPYAVWVSEIMLQQTQVKTVIPYFNRWLEAVPTIATLARARSAKIHKLWEGLGYYSRVRNMQAAAKIIVEQHGGRFPTRFEDILELPGIGRYTAGAICSIAFDEPAPIVDGNVIRVLTRLYGIGGDPHERSVNEMLWRLAEALVQEASLGGCCSQFNQSLMELGALVCTPRQPACEACPLKRSCTALRQGRVAQLPTLRVRPRATKRRFAAFVIENRGKLLVQQRPGQVLNGHLWEFPNVEMAGAQFDRKTAVRSVLGVKPETIQPLCRFEHSITRYRITLDAFLVSAGAIERVPGGRWLHPRKLERLAFTSAHGKILRHYMKGHYLPASVRSSRSEELKLPSA
jgi:A/G-specific adenine glycosylase